MDPITRIEGHLGIEVTVDKNVIKEAKSSGTLFRGFELILKKRDPRDANRLSQRVCGVCPAVHAKASALCLDDAFGLSGKITQNAKIIRNLILGSNFLQSHILHFYHLAALDYVDAKKAVGDIAPFTPRYEGDYRLDNKINQQATAHYMQALDIRRKSHEMLAIFGGKMPHNVGIIPGGVTEKPTEDKITNFLWRLNEIREFIDNCYIPDVIAVAKTYGDYLKIGKGCGNLLDYGGFEINANTFFKPGVVSAGLELSELNAEKITEDVKYSWFSDQTTGLHPSRSETVPQTEKKDAYSFIKSPRYDGKVVETGPLARMVIGYLQDKPQIKNQIDSLLSELDIAAQDLFSVMGRHAARAIEAKLVADTMAEWIVKLNPDEKVFSGYQLPETAQGTGLTAAPRGSLGHWISIKDSKIERYQIISPTSWNASPKDDKGNPGPIEQALIGTEIRDKENPFEVVRIIRTFDPCLACSMQLITPKGKKIGEFEVV
ncbi:MAG: nickel-dependent hydrogenase large subunit [Candidatus Omnitrophica bacterium]|nr:nickel-dependent hydrogenase large subunit [Candidatus Omnitrophota bacterium]